MDIAVDRVFEPKDAFRATVLASPPPSRTVWWPLVLIGFVAMTFATLAFLKSPLAQHPRIAPYANAALAKIP